MLTTNSELPELSLMTLAERIAQQDLSPVELTEAVLDKIDQHDATLRAYISVYRDEAMAQARQAEADIRAGYYRGSLHGIPMGLKDNLYYKDHNTTFGSKIHADFVPRHSATVIEKLEEAGIVFLGKLNLHEYALGVTTENPYYGTCRNPWNINKTVGGSSGGAGAAIPTGMSIGSIGTDTSGSIRIPAAACGIVGLKPTYGRVSKYGCFPEAWTLDHVGPMARSVADVAMILDAISGHDQSDPTSLNYPATQVARSLSGDIRGKSIGVNEAFFFNDVDNAVASVVWDTIRELEHQGAIVKPIDIPHIESAQYALTIIDTSETSTVHHANLRDRPQDYGEDVRFLLKCGELPSAVEYLEAQQIRNLLQRSFFQTFTDIDVLISPTLPIETPDIGQKECSINGRIGDTVENLMRLVGPANLLGLPSLSIPCGVLNSMPVGLQVIGPPLGEQIVLDMGQAIEKLDIF